MTKKDIQTGLDLITQLSAKTTKYQILERKMRATRAGKAVEAAAPELIALTQKVNAYYEACNAVGNARDARAKFISLIK